jgi:hypothetical protein
VLFIEAAFAMLYSGSSEISLDSYKVLDEGGRPAEALLNLTGGSAVKFCVNLIVNFFLLRLLSIPLFTRPR